MATPAEILQALDLLRRNAGTYGKRGNRWHEGGMEDALGRRRALEHDCCASCMHLKVETATGRTQHRIVMISCAMHHSPIELWRDVELGEEASCPDFTPPPTA